MRTFATCLAAFLACTSALAQPQDGAKVQTGDLSEVEVRVEKIAPGVAVLFGAAGNVGLSYGEDGNLLIDSDFADLTPKILSAVASVKPDPVRFLINTHFHFDHVGGNENIGRAGALIIAQDNARARMSKEYVVPFINRPLPAPPEVAVPVISFAEKMTLHFNDDEIQVVHVPHAHTDGDVLVYFRKAKVLHMGDLFSYRFSLPYIEIQSGGTIDGLIAAVKTALEITADDVRIIPGHGPVTGKAELRDYLAMLKDVRGKVSAARKAGRSLDQIKAMNIAARYEEKGGFITADKFVENVHASLEASTR